jgi:hypothetical protein
MGLDTKTYWLTGRQSQCDFDFNFSLVKLRDGSQPGMALSAEVEEALPLEIVTRKRLLWTLEAGEDLVLPAVFLKCVDYDGAVITCSSESCVKVVNKSIHPSQLRL